MKAILSILAFNLVSLACVLTAGVLADDGKAGWGWFLLVGLLTAVSGLRTRSKGDPHDAE